MEMFEVILEFAKQGKDIGVGILMALLALFTLRSFNAASELEKEQARESSVADAGGTVLDAAQLAARKRRRWRAWSKVYGMFAGLAVVVGGHLYMTAHYDWYSGGPPKTPASDEILLRGSIQIERTDLKLGLRPGKIYTDEDIDKDSDKNLIDFLLFTSSYDNDQVQIPFNIYTKGNFIIDQGIDEEYFVDVNFFENGKLTAAHIPGKEIGDHGILRITTRSGFKILKPDNVDGGSGIPRQVESLRGGPRNGYSKPWFFTAAFAETPPDLNKIAEFVRKQFRSGDRRLITQVSEDLVSLGQNGITVLENLLVDPGGSVPQTIYSVFALNKFLPEVSRTISDAAKRKVFSLTTHNKRSVRELALRYVRDHSTEENLDTLKKMLAATPETQSKRGISIAMSEAAYLLGIRYKEKIWGDQIGEPDNEKKEIAQKNYRKAVEKFEFAYSLKDETDSPDLLLSPKALYGWALTENMMARKGHVDRQAGIEKAKAKLRELISAAENQKAYPFPDHVVKAKAFIETGEFPGAKPTDEPNIVYYEKPLDKKRVVNALTDANLKVIVRPGTRNTLASNAIWWGSAVKREKVIEVGKILIDAGIKLRSIKPFNDPDKKINWIEIGAFAEYEKETLITKEKLSGLSLEGIPRRN